MEATKAYVGK